MWNAEYRIRLTRNFESLTVDMMPNRLNSGDCNDALDDWIEENENEDVNVCDNNVGEFERLDNEICLDDLSPDALSYIRKLESELSTANKVRRCMFVWLQYSTCKLYLTRIKSSFFH